MKLAELQLKREVLEFKKEKFRAGMKYKHKKLDVFKQLKETELRVKNRTSSISSGYKM